MPKLRTTAWVGGLRGDPGSCFIGAGHRSGLTAPNRGGESIFAGRLSAALGGAPVVPTGDFASAGVPIDWWPRLQAQVITPLLADTSGMTGRLAGLGSG